MSDRSCSSRKVRWPTQAAVETWLANYRATKHWRAPRMRAYRCAACHGYHVSKQQKWSRRPPRRRRL